MRIDIRSADRRNGIVEAIGELEQALALAEDDWMELGVMIEIARVAADAGRWDHAIAMVKEVLVTNETCARTFFYGNALQWANVVLGRAALVRGDVPSAARYLRVAGETPGSPQLKSFGPDFDLADGLLRASAPQAVLDYLESCKRFWKDHIVLLDRWKPRHRGWFDAVG